jgi:hypothetical protein
MMWIAAIIIALIPSILVLTSLRRRNLDKVAEVLWVIVVLVLPIIGPIAYLLVGPGTQDPMQSE